MITLHQKCILYKIGRDGYGQVTKLDEKKVNCRIKEKYQTVKNREALEKVSELEITLDKSAYVDFDYKIQIINDDGSLSREHSILSFKLTRNTIGEVVKKVVYV